MSEYCKGPWSRAQDRAIGVCSGGCRWERAEFAEGNSGTRTSLPLFALAWYHPPPGKSLKML